MVSKLCVIGAGAAGLVTIKHGIDFGCKVTAFEQTENVGGLWNYTDKVGVDVHTSMYRDLETNLPIELMAYPDEPFPVNENSFVPSNTVLEYYQSYADKYKLREAIMFNQQVIRVRPLQDDSWEVMVKNLKTGAIETHFFDAVLVCNGHYHASFIPAFEGHKIFKGRQIHSHNYRCAEPFRDERVLVIGGSFSAADIVQQVSTIAQYVTWSHHLKDKPSINYFGNNIDQRPDIQQITSDSVFFKDGTFRAFSVIIYCTGYFINLPFLSVDCGISAEEGYVKPLHKHCLSIYRPTLAIIGLPSLICPNQMFCLQARFCLTFITGRRKLPSRDQLMEEHELEMTAVWNRGLPKKKAHFMGPRIQDLYYIDLATSANVKPILPVIPMIHTFTHSVRVKDFKNFRKLKFIITDGSNFEANPMAK